MITIPTTADAIEAVAFEAGAVVEGMRQSVTVLTEGGVTLRLERSTRRSEKEIRAEALLEIADRLDTWEFPPGSDALEPMYLLVQTLRSEANTVLANPEVTP